MGITPLAIHVPAMAPMSSSIMIAGVELLIFAMIASSNVFHLHLKSAMASMVHTADEAKSDS